jgi:large subunit ribosomal protein L2
MGIRKVKPVTAGQRWRSYVTFEAITKDKPEKSLLLPKKKKGGRNCHGHVTVRHRGGGHKRKIRVVDFRRERKGDYCEVLAIEYDPNRSARIALVKYEDGEKRYIISPAGLKIKDKIVAAEDAELNIGNSLPLRRIPPGTPIHNIELNKGQGAVMVRSAGGIAQILAKEGDYAHIKLPSGEVRLISLDCYATVGQVGNIEQKGISIGKAGRKRWLGVRPTTRGVAKNPIDHPLGGGEGKSSGGRHPSTPWGKPTKGFKTRRRKPSDKLIVKRRSKK